MAERQGGAGHVVVHARCTPTPPCSVEWPRTGHLHEYARLGDAIVAAEAIARANGTPVAVDDAGHPGARFALTINPPQED